MGKKRSKVSSCLNVPMAGVQGQLGWRDPGANSREFHHRDFF